VFLGERGLPDGYELAAIALLVSGVVWCLNCHRTPLHSPAVQLKHRP
ncbi:hypothetical protein ALP07_05512, partial [Pseudomonas savastanoi pv. glycinea]